MVKIAISERRLTLFALLSEFEADMLDLIENDIMPEHDISQDLGTVAYSTIIDRASKDYVGDALFTDLSRLRTY